MGYKADQRRLGADPIAWVEEEKPILEVYGEQQPCAQSDAIREFKLKCI